MLALIDNLNPVAVAFVTAIVTLISIGVFFFSAPKSRMKITNPQGQPYSLKERLKASVLLWWYLTSIWFFLWIIANGAYYLVIYLQSACFRE